MIQRRFLLLLTLVLCFPLHGWSRTFCTRVTNGNPVVLPKLSDEEVQEEVESINLKIGQFVHEKEFKSAIVLWSVITFDHLSAMDVKGLSKSKILEGVYKEYDRLLLAHYDKGWGVDVNTYADGSTVFHGGKGKMVVISADGDIYYNSYDTKKGIRSKMIDGIHGWVPDYPNLTPWGVAPVIQP